MAGIDVSIAGAHVTAGPGQMTVTRYGKHRLEACAQDTDEYRERAASLGYGDDTECMSREHEVTHHLLAHWLGLPHSPTLYAVAHGHPHYPDWRREEAAVLGVQAYARANDIDLLDLAARIGRPVVKQSSARMSSLAARVLAGYDPTPAEIRSLAASVLSQDETP